MTLRQTISITLWLVVLNIFLWAAAPETKPGKLGFRIAGSVLACSVPLLIALYQKTTGNRKSPHQRAGGTNASDK